MYKRRALLIALCLALLGTLFMLPTTISRASTFTVDFDGGYGYSVVSGELVTGSDVGGYWLKSTQTPSLNDCSASTWIELNITVSPSYTITNIDAWYWTGGSGAAFNIYPAWSLYNGGTLVASVQNSHGPLNNWNEYNDNTPGFVGGDRLNLVYSACWLATDRRVGIDQITITFNTGPTPTPSLTPTVDTNLQGWNKPLRSAEQDPDNLSFHPSYSYLGLTGSPFEANADQSKPGYNSNIAISAHEINNVFAIHSGEIDSVVPLNCIFAPLGTPAQYCPIFWNTITVDAYYIDSGSAYLVTESLDDDRLVRYIVGNPRVAQGDTVSGGCLIGSTLRLVGLMGTPIGKGAAIVQGLFSDAVTAFDLSYWLTNEPSGVACAATAAQQHGSCASVANSSFDPAQGAWEPALGGPLGSVPYLQTGGITFPASVEQPLNLDSEGEYIITFMYTVATGASPQNLTLTLGTTSTSETLYPQGGEVTRTITAASYTPDRADGLYSLRVTAENGEANQTTLLFMCVSDSGSSPIADGEGCIVLDPMFNAAGLDSPWWDVGSSPEAVITPGMAELPDGATIKQNVLLNPKSGGAAQDYTLTVTYRRKGVTAAGESVGLIWSSDMINDGTFAAVDSQIWQTATDTITIETDPEYAVLEIEADGSDGDQIAQISKVCLTPVEGGTPPGFLPPPVFQGGCRVCIWAPTGDLVTDFWEFQQWLTCQFFQLWECQLKILLGRMWQTIMDILRFLGFLRIWLNATIIGLATWGNGNIIAFSRWLGGSLDNLGITFQNALTNLRSFTLITGSGAGFWDAIVAIANAISGMVQGLIAGIGTPIIGLLQQIITGLFGLIAGAMGIIGTLLTIAFTWLSTQASLLINLLGGIITALYTAVNTAAVAVPPGAPMCEAPGTVLYYPCLGFYVLDNTVFAGPVIYIIPIAMGLMSWKVLLWAVHRVKLTFSG